VETRSLTLPSFVKELDKMELKYNIPDLSSLKPFSATYMANYFFTGVGPKGREAYGLVMNFIRLVDLAIFEYENGRIALCQFATPSNATLIGLFIKASAHFEVCVSTLIRSMNHLMKMRGERKISQPLKDLLPRTLRGRKVERVRDEVKVLRDAIQHLEEKILKGETPTGKPIALMPCEDCIELGGYKISYSHLAEWLRELHGCARKLSRYREDGIAVK
jgi:hypothetical protein